MPKTEVIDTVGETLDAFGLPVEPAPLAVPEKPLTEVEKRRAKKEAEIEGIEGELLETSLSTLSDAMRFGDIDPGTKAPPEEWVAEFGPERAARMHRIASAAWLSAKEAPVGILVAKGLAVGIIAAKAKTKAAPRSLSVAYITLSPDQLPAFPVRKEVRDG